MNLPSPNEKANYVHNLFQGLALKYDLMNDLITIGLHRIWKRFACKILTPEPGDRILDLACGTGDLAFYLEREYSDLNIIGLDFSENMLNIAKERAEARGSNINFIHGNAMEMPFEDEYFNKVIISYGLRNLPDYQAALREIYRVIKPGGKLVILDMSCPSPFMNILTWPHRYIIVPLLGRLIANTQESYQYLVRSIEIYLAQDELSNLLEEEGWKSIEYRNLFGGVSAIHQCHRD